MLPLVSVWIRTGLEAQRYSIQPNGTTWLWILWDFIKINTSWLSTLVHQKKEKPFSFPLLCGVFVGFFLSLIFRKGWSAYVWTDKTARSVFCCISRESVTERKQNKNNNFLFCFNLAELSNLEIQRRSTCLYGQAVKGKSLCWLVFQLEVFSLASIKWKVCVCVLPGWKQTSGAGEGVFDQASILQVQIIMLRSEEGVFFGDRTIFLFSSCRLLCYTGLSVRIGKRNNARLRVFFNTFKKRKKYLFSFW